MADHNELQHQSNLAEYNAKIQSLLEQKRTVNIAGQSALKACIFLNAGSAVALLAFIANIWDQPGADHIALKIVFSIASFSIGALLGSISTGFTYLSQFAWDMDREKLGYFFNNASNALILMAYNLFIIGGFVALTGIGEKFGLNFVMLVSILFYIILIIINILIIIGMIAVLKIKK